MHGALDVIARGVPFGFADLRGLVRGLHEAVRRRSRARTTAAREALFESERGRRERYFASASDGADLERRQRGWERAEPRGWP